MKRKSGFTLIELVVVIVILGILAVTAAPRFVNISSDAKKNTLKGLVGAINSAFTLVHSKAVLEGKTGTDETLNNGIKVRHGFPTFKDGGLDKAVTGLSNNFKKQNIGPPGSGMIQYSFEDDPKWNEDKTGCNIKIEYNSGHYDSIPPTIKLYDDGC